MSIEDRMEFLVNGYIKQIDMLNTVISDLHARDLGQHVPAVKDIQKSISESFKGMLMAVINPRKLPAVYDRIKSELNVKNRINSSLSESERSSPMF